MTVQVQRPSIDYQRLINAALGRGAGVDKGDSVYQTLPDIVEWAEQNFFVAETRRPIELAWHQKDILNIFTERRPDGRFKWTTLMYSTIKKSGKTTISGLYARWACETWGAFQEVYNMGNKLKQAQERAFAKVYQSIRLAPESIRQQWDLQATRMTHLPSESTITAIPINAEGEAGGNPSLTVWTELWGFQYEAARRFWDEMQPVATRHLSQRFIDTYAGFSNESLLLKSYWDLGLAGERLHPDLPLYGNAAAGLCAYIDTGVEARRMVWQLGDIGHQYYEQAAKTETPNNYQRLHMNEWAESQASFIQMGVWDSLVTESPTPYPTRGVKPEVRIAVDAAISGDCTAAVAGYMDDETFVELETFIYTPLHGQAIDYTEDLLPALELMLSRYRVTTLAYDPFQMHEFMTQLSKHHRGVSFLPFNQGADREKADTALLTRLRQGQLIHTGNPFLRQHVENADAKNRGDKNAIRIVKRVADKPIDAAVALSMCAYSWVLRPRATSALMTRVASPNLYKPLKVRDRA